MEGFWDPSKKKKVPKRKKEKKLVFSFATSMRWVDINYLNPAMHTEVRCVLYPMKYFGVVLFAFEASRGVQ